MTSAFVSRLKTPLLILGFATTSAMAFEGQVPEPSVTGEDVYSPFVGRAYPDQVLFGDLHFHTEISFDAGLIGTSLTMRFALRVVRRFCRTLASQCS